MKTRARNYLLLLFSVGALSCFSPDLTTQIYQCDRGRCPEDFYCIDTKYCTQVVPHCQVGGIQISEAVAVCVGAKTAGDANTICSMGYSTATCDMTMQKGTLCSSMSASSDMGMSMSTGPSLDATNCAYCCK